MITLHIGIDDTDSPRMGCTTYVAALLVERFSEMGVEFIDYPNLVRLNPNVPWKTRGNGALCLRTRFDEALIDEVIEVTADTVEKNADLQNDGTDPGIVFFPGHLIPEKVKAFAKQTIRGVVRMRQALRLIKAFKAEALGFKKGRGIIGALASVGETLEEDHSYELIAYRKEENRGTPRRVDPASVREMDKKTSPYTFNNVDPETGRVLITPRGPDPVLYGIRGENPEIVKKAHETVRSMEPVERWVIFRTNQGTDAHLQLVRNIRDIQPFRPVIVRGVVAVEPRIVPRRHVVFTIADETGKIDCAAYEPTGTLRKIAKKLMVGDLVEAYGGVRPASEKNPLTVNLEKLRILKLAPKVVFKNPICPRCGKRMKSMGTNKGFRCEKCGFRSKELKKTVLEEGRDLREGLYVTAPRSQRHLAKPLRRYGLEKRGKPEVLIDGWHSP